MEWLFSFFSIWLQEGCDFPSTNRTIKLLNQGLKFGATENVILDSNYYRRKKISLQILIFMDIA